MSSQLSVFIILAVAAAVFSADRAGATTDSIRSVLVPVENVQAEGYCAREAVAWDAISSPTTAIAIIGEVLSRPQSVFVLGQGGSDSIDVNPITSGEPAITVRTAGEDLTRPTVSIEIGSGGADADAANTMTRAKLALVFAVQNLLALEPCAKITATISGLPEQPAGGGARLYAKTQHPYARRSPHLDALIRELRSDERCMVGRPIGAPPVGKAAARPVCK